MAATSRILLKRVLVGTMGTVRISLFVLAVLALVYVITWPHSHTVYALSIQGYRPVAYSTNKQCENQIKRLNQPAPGEKWAIFSIGGRRGLRAQYGTGLPPHWHLEGHCYARTTLYWRWSGRRPSPVPIVK